MPANVFSFLWILPLGLSPFWLHKTIINDWKGLGAWSKILRFKWDGDLAQEAVLFLNKCWTSTLLTEYNSILYIFKTLTLIWFKLGRTWILWNPNGSFELCLLVLNTYSNFSYISNDLMTSKFGCSSYWNNSERIFLMIFPEQQELWNTVNAPVSSQAPFASDLMAVLASPAHQSSPLFPPYPCRKDLKNKIKKKSIL